METLTRLDAAPARPLSAVEEQRRDVLLTTILGSFEPPAPAPTGSPARRRMWWAVAAVGAATAVVGVGGLVVSTVPGVSRYITNRPISDGDGTGSTILSAASLSAWTATASTLDSHSGRGSRAIDWCRDHLSGDPDNQAPVQVALSDLRGEVASVVLTRGPDVTLCLVGPDGSGLSELNGAVPAQLDHDALLLETAGGHGQGATGFSYAGGFAGDDVAGLSIHGPHHTVEATIGGGRWTAWWPSPDTQGVDDGSDVTITLRDGSERTVDYGSLPRAQ